MSVYIGDKCVDFINTTTNVVKPYDSKIEYLMGDGTAYIDLSVIPSAETAVEATIQLSTISTEDNWPSVCGMRGTISGAENQRYAIRFSNNLTATAQDSSFFQKSASPTSPWTGGRGPYKIAGLVKTRVGMNVNGCYIVNNDGTSISIYTQYTPSSVEVFDRSLYLFDIHLVSEVVSPSNNGKDLMIYSFNLFEKDTVLKLIPVRKGTTGYMYDEVSGQLFGNVNPAGGAFILGPDIN